METRALLAPGVTSPPRQCRARVLDLLRPPGSPLDGHEVADRGRLNPDTARFHLDGLSMMPDPGKAALEAGREWDFYLTEQSPPTSGPAPGRPIERLAATMGKLGFAPRPAPTAGGTGCLHQCPFREVAQQHQDVVCSLHLGLMQGALAQMRAPLTAGRLDALTERGLCIAHLTARDGPGPRLPPADTA